LSNKLGVLSCTPSYKLLLYISYCLAGRAFPTGDIPRHLVRSVKWEVYRRLLAKTATDSSEADAKPYPYTRALLQFDTRGTLL
jgi:hypothetical protein